VKELICLPVQQAYGYIPLNDSVKKWKADYVFDEANEIIALVE
jgi:hypothetical protein